MKASTKDSTAMARNTARANSPGPTYPCTRVSSRTTTSAVMATTFWKTRTNIKATGRATRWKAPASTFGWMVAFTEANSRMTKNTETA